MTKKEIEQLKSRILFYEEYVEDIENELKRRADVIEDLEKELAKVRK